MASEQTCENCRHFIDYREPDDLPDEPNGYCGYLVDTHGLDEAVRMNEYGGHWTHHTAWCEHWSGGTPEWIKEGDR